MNDTYPNYNRLISFISVHHAIRAEKVLLASGLHVVAIPTPREIDISCGQCLLFQQVEEQVLLQTLQLTQVEWSKLFTRDHSVRVYEKLADYFSLSREREE